MSFLIASRVTAPVGRKRWAIDFATSCNRDGISAVGEGANWKRFMDTSMDYEKRVRPFPLSPSSMA
ncbi:hypothetical protein N5J77_05830 [Sphingobium yanoikuyae]|uniref:Uncharacterized protein n=1 Tax=Sphingobium yanoikuyae TaxID=13690 RepID=A0AA43B6U4_SPHYA|nr:MULTISPECIES: hypothetical protein [Sphingobium]MDH2130636.1 hypothetical protein [Sphingobium yanoikuyae]MDH2166167.1 hypothetical protein [Sphingobium yanoikuyae]